MNTITYSHPMDGRRAMSIDATWARRYTIIYRVVTSNARIGVQQVILQCPVRIGSTYSYGAIIDNTLEIDTGSWVQTITGEPEATGDGKNWLVTVEYGPKEPPTENPLDATPTVTWDFVSAEEIVDKDTDGKPVINSAYDYFDPPLTREKRDPIVTVVRNEATFDYDLAFAMQDVISSDVFLGAAAGLWKINKITGVAAESIALDGTKYTYWIVTYELQFNRNGWKRPVLNQGMRQLNTTLVNGVANGWEPILVNGQPISSPAPLDNAGRALNPNATIVYKTFKVYFEMPFTNLNFHGIDFGKGPI